MGSAEWTPQTASQLVRDFLMRRKATSRAKPSRRSGAALRGYAFQLYGSVLAWLALKEGEDLFIEVAEDYAVVAKDALKAVQAKETRASGAVTLNTASRNNSSRRLQGLAGAV